MSMNKFRVWLLALFVSVALIVQGQGPGVGPYIPGIGSQWQPQTQYQINQQVLWKNALWGANITNQNIAPGSDGVTWTLLLGYVASGGSTSNENLPYNSTVNFSTTTTSSRVLLSGNMTFILPSGGNDGQTKCLTFVHDGTGNIYTVTPPNNVAGFMTAIGIKRSQQCFIYYTADSQWLATSPGVVLE
jgi:hypothetical protein